MVEYKGHRRFAAIWDWSTKHESQAEREMRQLAGSRVHGRVLELGAGVGANWSFLPEGIEYVGIEPDPYMIHRAEQRMVEVGHAMPLQQAVAESLPFEDETFDSVLVTLSLCSVQDPAQVLGEVRRVLVPGGVFVFSEHVRPAGRVWGWLADSVTPVWRRTFAGCHPNRLTRETIEGSGLEIETISRRRMGGLPTISGIARKS